MLRIALCDDEDIFINEMMERVTRFIKKSGEECEIFCARSGAELIGLCEKHPIDAVLLDISMPVIDGFKTAERISKIRKNIILVFVSGSEQLVYHSFEYTPLWFVPKSNMAMLDAAMDKIVKKIKADREEEKFVPVKVENKVFEVDLKEVFFVKTEDHYLSFVKRNRTPSDHYREKLDKIEAQLKEHGFIRIHNRYLVNLRAVSVIDKSTCVLLDGEELPISRMRLAQTKETFQKFLRSMG